MESVKIGDSFATNTHTSAIQRYWYEQKSLIVEGKGISLPIAAKIETLDYYIGASSIDNGTYYFKTILVVNGKEIRVDTAVKPKDGIWEVDIKETFMLAHISTLDHHINSYIASLDTLDSLLEDEYIWGIGQMNTEENEEYLQSIIAERFDKAENEILVRYRATE